MAKVVSPFVVKLHYAFISPMDLVLVMPFLRGGDLNYYLTSVGAMAEDMAKFYIGEILLGETRRLRHIRHNLFEK